MSHGLLVRLATFGPAVVNEAVQLVEVDTLTSRLVVRRDDGTLRKISATSVVQVDAAAVPALVQHIALTFGKFGSYGVQPDVALSQALRFCGFTDPSSDAFRDMRAAVLDLEAVL